MKSLDFLKAPFTLGVFALVMLAMAVVRLTVHALKRSFPQAGWLASFERAFAFGAWSVVAPVLEGWEAQPAANFPNYASGSWGPPCADRLIGEEGRAWFNPDGAADAPAGTADGPHL